MARCNALFFRTNGAYYTYASIVIKTYEGSRLPLLIRSLLASIKSVVIVAVQRSFDNYAGSVAQACHQIFVESPFVGEDLLVAEFVDTAPRPFVGLNLLVYITIEELEGQQVGRDGHIATNSAVLKLLVGYVLLRTKIGKDIVLVTF